LLRSSSSRAIDIEVAGLSNMQACKAESIMMQSFAPFSWISDVTRCDTTPSWTQNVLKHMLSAPYTSCILEFHRTRGGKSTTAHESSACSHPVRAATSKHMLKSKARELRGEWQLDRMGSELCEKATCGQHQLCAGAGQAVGGYGV